MRAGYGEKTALGPTLAPINDGKLPRDLGR